MAKSTEKQAKVPVPVKPFPTVPENFLTYNAFHDKRVLHQLDEMKECLRDLQARVGELQQK